MTKKPGVEHVDQRTLNLRFGTATVRYKGKVVMKNGVPRDTPLAQEWWKKKRKKVLGSYT